MRTIFHPHSDPVYSTETKKKNGAIGLISLEAVVNDLCWQSLFLRSEVITSHYTVVMLLTGTC